MSREDFFRFFLTISPKIQVDLELQGGILPLRSKTMISVIVPNELVRGPQERFLLSIKNDIKMSIESL